MANIKDPRAGESTSTINFQEDIVTVSVGPDGYAYQVHKSYLARAGTFFETALKKKWTRETGRTIHLPEDDPYSFELYLQWLYTGKLFCKPAYEASVKTTGRNYETLIDLYVLGQKLLDREFQDRVVDATIATTYDYGGENDPGRSFPGDGVVDTLYRHTSEWSPMRRLMVDFYVRHGRADWMVEPLCESSTHLNKEFLVDLIIALYKLKADGTMLAKLEELDANPGCEYHHHGKDEECGSYVKKSEAW